MINTNENDIDRVLSGGVEAVLPTPAKLKDLMLTGKRLRLYVGVDPTSPNLHLGHALQLMKMREFQDLGHEVILLIGSFTAMIGDPTDKLAARTQLTKEQVLENAKTYQKQAERILDFTGPNAVQIKYNDEWLAKLTFAEVVDLASHFTVQQMMERDMFERRLEEGKPIHLHEFFYPLMQGYDSVAMDVDLEIGGSDQTFNMLAGRTLQRSMKNREKFVLTLKLLTNDEGKKMSKSEGGVIALNDAPEEKFGKVMAMADGMMIPYTQLVLGADAAEIKALEQELASGVNPRDIKMRLASKVVEQFDGAEAAIAAADYFTRVFQQHELPVDMPQAHLHGATPLLDVLVGYALATSKTEARTLITQGAIKVNEEVVTDMAMILEGHTDYVIQRGKRNFLQITAGH